MLQLIRNVLCQFKKKWSKNRFNKGPFLRGNTEGVNRKAL